MAQFTQTIGIIGINPVVDPPERVLRDIFDQAGREKGTIPVRGRLNGVEFIQTLVKYQGGWRLYINGPMLKDSGLSVGDSATIEIEFDPRPREVPIPPKLMAALKTNAIAKKAFDSLPPSRQKEILRYIGSLKSGESIQRNVERVIAQLTGSHEEPPAFMRR